MRQPFVLMVVLCLSLAGFASGAAAQNGTGGVGAPDENTTSDSRGGVGGVGEIGSTPRTPIGLSNAPTPEGSGGKPLDLGEAREQRSDITPTDEYDPSDYLVRITVGLVIFVALVVGIIWFLRRNPKMKRYMSGAVEVVSRSYLGSRYSVFVLKVGDRLLVVGQGPEGLATLSEITSPDEVTQILTTVREQAPDSMTSTFKDMLSSVSARADKRAEKRADKEMKRRERKTENLDSRQSSFLDARIDERAQSDTVELSQQARQSREDQDKVVVDSQAKLAAIREHLEKNRARLQ